MSLMTVSDISQLFTRHLRLGASATDVSFSAFHAHDADEKFRTDNRATDHIFQFDLWTVLVSSPDARASVWLGVHPAGVLFP